MITSIFTRMFLSFYKPTVVLSVGLLLVSCGEGSPSDNLTQPVNDSPGQTGSAPTGEFNDTSFLITNNEAAVYKVSPITGAAQVVVNFEDDFEFVPPADVIGDIVYMSANDNSINAMNASTGRFLWDTPIGVYQNARFANFPSAVVCDDSTCWARGSTGVLMAVDASNGTPRWLTPLHPSGGFEEELDGSEILVTEDKIYLTAYKVGTALFPDSVDPALFVINRSDGTILQKIELNFTGRGVPRIIGHTLLVSTWREILAFDVTSYELLWSISDPALGFTRADVVGNVVVFGAFDGEDHVIAGADLASGTPLWSVPAGSADNPYSSTTDGQLIYSMVGESDTSTFYTPPGEGSMAINPSDGSIVWMSDGLITFTENPLVVFGKAFYGYHTTRLDENLDSAPRGLTAVNAQTGAVEWVNSSLDTPGLAWFTNTPTLIHDGKAYRSSLYPDVMP